MHNLQCEHSATDPKRCRCTQCRGAKHGIQAPIPQANNLGVHLTPDPVPQASNLGIHHWFEAWVSA
jgi:hypothetical protein